MSTSLDAIRIIYIGCGHMGSALVRASVASGATHPAQYVLVDHHPDRLFDLATQGALVLSHIGELDAAIESLHPVDTTLVVLGVKPQSFSEVLASISPQILADSVVLSLGVGVRLDTLMDQLPSNTPVARVMPNLGAQVGNSASSLCVSQTMSDQHKELVFQYCASFGSVAMMTEDQIDSAGVVAGSSPALFATIIHELGCSAEAHGLDYATAVSLAVQTMESTARILAQGADPQRFVSQVCSPQGTTEAGLNAARQMIESGVQRFAAGALARTQELRNGA